MKSFAERCYGVLRKVPKGSVTTYKDIGNALKSKAYRAVGNAMNKNPYAPKVPCHRVIRSDGFVGQFAKGKNEKIRLLKSEGVDINNKGFIDLKKYSYKFKR
jgi:methylated-DNA-[protein]-cysteine S-methyltransferase